MDPIADMLTRIMNAQAVRKERVVMPFSKVKLRIAQLLKEAGYLAEIERTSRKARTADVEVLDLALRYTSEGGAISGVRLMSRPSRHLYAKAKELRPVRSGYGSSIVSTSKGIMTGTQARKENVGGEVLFEVW